MEHKNYSHYGYARELSKELPFDLVVTTVKCACCGEEYALWWRPKGSTEDFLGKTLLIYLQNKTPECLDRAARVLLKDYERVTGPYPGGGVDNHEGRTNINAARLIYPE